MESANQAVKLSVPPPPRRGLQITPPPKAPEEPTPVETIPDNMSKPNARFQDLNFKVSPELHKKFRVEAANRGMSMKDLLEASFNCYMEKYPRD